MQLDIKTWKYTFEMRFSASANFFDKRGCIITKFKGDPFVHWRIQRNRIDLYDKVDYEDKSICVFAGFKNIGVSVEDPPSYNYFKDHLQRWVRAVASEIDIDKINRIGLRVINLVKIGDVSFEELFEHFINSYLVVDNELWGLKTARAKDVGIILDLESGKDKMHVVTGPMKQKQAEGYFECAEVKERLPLYSIFNDVDYFSENPNFEERRMIQSIARFVDVAKGKIESHLREFSGMFVQKGG